MNTILMQKDKEKVVDVLRQGKIVALPTDTVYGLAVLYGSVAVLEALKKCKKRPEEKPIPIMVSSIEQMSMIAYVNDTAMKLANAFMPGAFTMILKKKEEVPDCLTNGYDTIAIRMPDDPFILDVIRQCERPLFVTSANLSGEQPGETDEEVYMQLHNRVDAIVQGKTKGASASTIVEICDKGVHVVRVGPITNKMIQQTLSNA